MNFPYTCFNLPTIHMTDEVRAEYVRNLWSPGGATAILNYYRACLDPRFLSLEENDDIRQCIETPVLLIWGEQDMVAAKDSSYVSQQLVPNFSSVYLPHLHHWVNQEAPELANHLMGEWLQKKAA